MHVMASNLLRSPSYSLWIDSGSHEALHAPERGAHGCVKPPHPQAVQEQELGVDHVLDGHQGEGHGVLSSREGIDGGGSDGAVAAPDKVGADDKEPVCVQCTAGTYKLLPPAFARAVLGRASERISMLEHQHKQI